MDIVWLKFGSEKKRVETSDPLNFLQLTKKWRDYFITGDGCQWAQPGEKLMPTPKYGFRA
jgi:hypothetical protein